MKEVPNYREQFWIEMVDNQMPLRKILYLYSRICMGSTNNTLAVKETGG